MVCLHLSLVVRGGGGAAAAAASGMFGLIGKSGRTSKHMVVSEPQKAIHVEVDT